MGSLRYDRDQRYQTIREIVRRLEIPVDSRVLDIGGGTGDLPRVLGFESFWTVDVFGGGPNHVRASMDSLPFPARSFDLVLQSDALEHIPARGRGAALEAMARAAGKWLIWIGPVHSELTARVEEDLCETHRRLFAGREMDWLAEHRYQTLPDPEQVVGTLSAEFEDWAWWPSCGLLRWWSAKRLELQLDSGVYRPQFEAAVNRWYAESGWKPDYRVPEGVPSYRWVFVGVREGKLHPEIDSPPVGQEDLEEWRSLIPVIEALVEPSGLGPDGQATEEATARSLERMAGLLEVLSTGPMPVPNFLLKWFGGGRGG
ncbi:MAG: class I SAM-dependent methyltransferase [Candidatus Omnitrophica bacterium]|nr:hypothetical protein [bacterium]NUN96418.1 class I SAM-dependent methyltransferase [Candidatus Omnitrophota bacterium]